MTVNTADLARITDLRVSDPRAVGRALRERKRRTQVTTDGRLMLVAADHPARGALSAGGDAQAMADRVELLRRLAIALAQPGVHGVLGSADILEDLALLGALDDKVVIGTMNRGGILGTRWELDDRMTAYDAAHLASMGLDGGKMLLRIEETDAGVARTIEACAKAVTDLADRQLLALVEPLPYRTLPDSGVALIRDDAKLLRAATIAAGLGATSAYTWLKLPAWADVAMVAAASTLPVLILGGDVGIAVNRAAALVRPLAA